MLLVLLVAFQAVVAWMPFEPDMPRRVDNGVSRHPDGSLEVGGPRAVALADPPEALAEAGAGDTVRLDLEIQPARSNQGGPARIFSYSAGTSDANLMVGQEGSDLVVRVRHPGSDSLGRPPLQVPDAFEAGSVTAAVTVRPDSASVAVEGHEPAVIEFESAALPLWDPTYQITVGDEVGGGRVWHGRMVMATLSVAGRRIDYLAPGRLTIPQRSWDAPVERWRESLIPSPFARARSVLHLVAFLPIGALLLLLQRGAGRPAAVLRPTLAVSVLLQAGKFVVAGRHPSWLDVGAHLLGALIGAAVLARLAERRHRWGL